MAQESVLPKHYQTTLKNGLEVFIIPLKNQSNVITTDIFYKVGSRNETMGKSGIAHMLEHLNFKSTKNLKAGEFDKIVKSFSSTAEAGRELGVNYKAIHKVLNMPNRTAYGYKWISQ